MIATATQRLMQQYKTVLDGLKAIDKDRLLRNSLGEESLDQAGFLDKYDSILKRANFAFEYGPAVNESIMSAAINIWGIRHRAILRGEME